MNAIRQYWIESMCRIVNPVFESLAVGKLKDDLPCRFYGPRDRSHFGCLEAFGRSFCGFAPFISEVPGRDEAEAAVVAHYRTLLTACLDRATDPEGPDYMNFGQVEWEQPLVDVAFLCHGLYRSGDFAHNLPEPLKKQICSAVAVSRDIIPGPSNWLLFSAMTEVGIDLMGGQADLMRVLYAVRQFQQWYRGDGMYGDGVPFHMDYYNSFVIRPMLIDVCRHFADRSTECAKALPVFLDRAARYSQIQERMIHHDGTYVYTGRSITYRFGAFQLLAQSMLQRFSPLSPASVRCALTAVMERFMQSPIFDEHGFLLHGLYAEQPSLAEDYICTGSLYLCSAVFLPLGLPENDPFWSDPDEAWTSLRIVRGEDVLRDHCI